MSNSKNSTTLYAIIAVLVMALAASIGYNIGSVNSNNGSNSNSSVNAINAKVLKEIEDLKTIYDTKIAQKTATYNDLESEKQKVQKLLVELEQTKGNANSLLKYKEQYQNLESKMRLLVDEIVVLKTNKSKAVTKIKAVKSVIGDTKKPNLNSNSFTIKNKKKPTLSDKTNSIATKNEAIEKNESVTPTVVIPEKKAEKVFANLDVMNLKSAAYISKSTSKQEETTSANKANLIKISFSVEANPDAKAEEKRYFIQVVNGNNKVIGRRITEFLDDKSITYSLSKTIQYDNQWTQITQELVADEFEKGIYTVNVYERSRLVGKTTFTLK
jgi:hypothetical protein